MTDYEYDENLPYVVETALTGRLVARFAGRAEAIEMKKSHHLVIDTTPKPRVPEDAKFITWPAHGEVFMARRTEYGDWDMNRAPYASLEDLPGVTPDTVFTVLDAREERGSDDV